MTVDREQMTPLPPIRTVLQTSRRDEAGTTSVALHARLTEIGTLDLWCSEVGTRRTWRLQFDVRSTTRTDVAAHDAVGERQGFIDEETWEACRRVIEETFGPAGNAPPAGLVKRLGEILGPNRRDWPASVLRRIWETLIANEAGRRRSAVHEARWLNLLGYAHRPGYGLAADDWRVASYVVVAGSDEEARERDIVDLRQGQRIMVDDGSCPGGQIKEVTGVKLTTSGVARAHKCVPRMGTKK